MHSVVAVPRRDFLGTGYKKSLIRASGLSVDEFIELAVEASEAGVIRLRRSDSAFG
jgi:hypothetical protein